jgi:tRNA(Met) C34 N-acetyltransferase TmcA
MRLHTAAHYKIQLHNLQLLSALTFFLCFNFNDEQVMSLYTAAHYKNQPNDLQLLSDAPAHHLFVLLGPSAEKQGARGELPDVLCVIQVRAAAAAPAK